MLFRSYVNRDIFVLKQDIVNNIIQYHAISQLSSVEHIVILQIIFFYLPLIIKLSAFS